MFDLCKAEGSCTVQILLLLTYIFCTWSTVHFIYVIDAAVPDTIAPKCALTVQFISVYKQKKLRK
jgi:hypothetical protein